MKNFLLLIAAVFLLAACQNRDASLSEVSDPGKIVIGQMDSLRSEILDETRNIWVHIP